MKREEKIQAIYEEIADKTTSFGCWFIDKYGDKYQFAGEPLIPEDWVKIGHPVMIGDIIDYIKEKWRVDGANIIAQHAKAESDIHSLLKHWRHSRLPIGNQSDECIDFIYNLIQNNENN